jgi:hypothetical protein
LLRKAGKQEIEYAYHLQRRRPHGHRLKYAAAEKGLKGLILVHGELDAESVFRAKLAQAGQKMVVYPDLFTSMDL